ncbi:MAG: DNA repair protein RecO [Herpetosiphon sp.]
MNERVYRSEAIVLRRSDYGEADRLITLYTPGRGKLRVIAKGVRKTTSRLGGHIELFMRCNLLMATGRNLDIITQAEVVETYGHLRENLQGISHAYYVAELLDRVTGEGEEQRAVFNLLVQTLQGLDSGSEADMFLRFFELRLLGLIGYQPAFFYCVRCQAQLTESAERWLPPHGMLCPNCAAISPGSASISLAAFKALRFLQRQSFAEVSALRLSEPLQREIEAVLRPMVGAVIERPLKSAAFLNAVRD